MPKQKKYKNLLKVAATTNSSIDKSAAAGSASQAKSTAGSASLVKSVAAGSASQAKSAAGSASLVKSAAAGTASQAKSAAGSASQAKSTAAAPTTSKTSSQSLHSEPSSVAPTTSERSSEPTRKRERESKHYWTVDAIDEYGVITSPHLLVKNVDNIPEGLRIIVHFDEEHAAIGEAAGLLAGVCGQLNLCKRNQEIRHKQTIPHTSGAKSIARRKTELVKETGKKVTRVEMWDITHKKKGGSYVNEKAKEIAEKIEAHNTQQSVDLTGNSPLDALGVVLGKEHPGHVRGLGMGAVPTVAFKNTTTRITHMNLGSSSDVGTSSTCGSNVQEELDTVKAQLQALVSYIASKEGGKIPDELAAMFLNQTTSQDML